MIIIDGVSINNLYDAYLWLKEAWMYEPYNIYYEEYDGEDHIDIEPCDEDDPGGWIICNLEEFKRFIN